ncbi:MAG: hypothetical protein ACHQ4H_07495, partial [Ktedonobacterales bacterium]
MARPPATTAAPTTNRRRRATLVPASVRLAGWRLRQMWRLLLIAGLGNIAAVLLVCIVPLFTQVALSAGLRNVVSDQANGAQIVVNAFGAQPTEQAVTAIQHQLDQLIASDMGTFVTSAAPQFSVSLPDLLLTPDASGGGSGNGASNNGQLQINGADIT